jgi:SNF family Na+-dependent transporter
VRKLAGILSYSFAAFGTLLSLGGFLHAQDFRRRHADTGDFTGAAMLESFLIIFIVPMTLTALTAAIWLLPPTRAFAGRKDRDEVSGAEAILALTLVVFGVGYLAFVRYLLGSSFDGVNVLVVVLSPAIVMLITLSLAAWRLARANPARKSPGPETRASR